MNALRRPRTATSTTDSSAIAGRIVIVGSVLTSVYLTGALLFRFFREGDCTRSYSDSWSGESTCLELEPVSATTWTLTIISTIVASALMYVLVKAVSMIIQWVVNGSVQQACRGCSCPSHQSHGWEWKYYVVGLILGFIIVALL